jgi:hypothetical protein
MPGLSDLKAAIAAKRTELRALEASLHEARSITPLPAGLFYRRQSEHPEHKRFWDVINVYLDGKRVGTIEDLSNPHGTQFRPKVIGKLTTITPSLNAAIWFLLESEGLGERDPGSKCAVEHTPFGGSGPAPKQCRGPDCTASVEPEHTLCGYCSDRLCVVCMRIDPTAVGIHKCDECRKKEAVAAQPALTIVRPEAV